MDNKRITQTIKTLNISEYTYELGYELFREKVYPRLEIYKEEKVIGHCSWLITSNKNNSCFQFSIYGINKSHIHFSNNINLMLNKIRKDLRVEIPIEVEKEFENIFNLYKMNDFKEI